MGTGHLRLDDDPLNQRKPIEDTFGHQQQQISKNGQANFFPESDEGSSALILFTILEGYV